MASSIAAITTGTGGIQQTADASGNLNLVSGTTTIVAMTSAGIAVTGTLTASGTTTLVTPVLGTPASGNLANCTGAVVASLSTASGSAPSYSARAWVNFDGTGTVAIRGSGNVSSITDNGTGDYTVNFTTAMSDVNYSMAASAQLNTTVAGVPRWVGGKVYATGSIRVEVVYQNVLLEDCLQVNVNIFR